MSLLWRLAVERPHLLLGHVAGYGQLVQQDGSRSLQQVVRRLLALALAFGGFIVSAVLAGVALLLAPELSAPWWLLLAVPLAPAAVALAAVWAVRRQGPLPLGVALREQWAADRALLRRWGP